MDGNRVECKLRFKCKICKHTHAILVKDMIPFSVYAIRSIAKIVSYRISGQAIVMAEKENWISHQYFYQCIKRFEQEKPKLSMLYKNQVLENQLADREKQLIQVFERRQIPTVELSFFMQYQWPLFM